VCVCMYSMLSAAKTVAVLANGCKKACNKPLLRRLKRSSRGGPLSVPLHTCRNLIVYLVVSCGTV